MSASIGEVQADLRRVIKAINSASARDWQDLDISMAQLKALFVLTEENTLAVGALAARLGVGMPAASLLADRLVQAGLVRRRDDAEDRRRVLIELTARGAELTGRLQQGRTRLLEDLLAGLSADDLEALARGLRALAAVAEGQPVR